MESERAWIKAGDLRPGMTLRTPSGGTVELTANRHFDERQRTHDLTITGIHDHLRYESATDYPVITYIQPTGKYPKHTVRGLEKAGKLVTTDLDELLEVIEP
ncbi:hypothetical protein ACFYZJ_13890 [Streptomyces sp. NPDC001848]|uniref:hypothetical protein n=1 Tax=Streptomyces sp. NPDC001848 TaxID=3364618 RepID=UPI0036CE408C